MKKLSVFLVSLLLLSVGCSTNNIEPVANFKVDKFSGKWYEIARKPHSFEEGMSNVSAQYECLPSGKIKVTNTGWISDDITLDDGTIQPNFEKKMVTGTAKLASDLDVGHLKVSFFWPFYGDFKVVDLAPDYSSCIVTGGSMEYLWILSREPFVDKAELELLLQKAALLGFTMDDIIIVDQKQNYIFHNSAFNKESELTIEQ